MMKVLRLDSKKEVVDILPKSAMSIVVVYMDPESKGEEEPSDVAEDMAEGETENESEAPATTRPTREVSPFVADDEDTVTGYVPPVMM